MPLSAAPHSEHTAGHGLQPCPAPPCLQKLSLFSCACALGAAPIIMGIDAGTTMTAKTRCGG